MKKLNESILSNLAASEKRGLKKLNEASYYNWRNDINDVTERNDESSDELFYAVAENIMENHPEDYPEATDPLEIVSDIIGLWEIPKDTQLYDYLLKWYGSKEEMEKHVRDYYETSDAIYFVTGCNYSIFDADLLGGNADGETARAFDKFVENGGVKEPVNESADTSDVIDITEEINYENCAKAIVDLKNKKLVVTSTKATKDNDGYICNTCDFSANVTEAVYEKTGIVVEVLGDGDSASDGESFETEIEIVDEDESMNESSNQDFINYLSNDSIALRAAGITGDTMTFDQYEKYQEVMTKLKKQDMGTFNVAISYWDKTGYPRTKQLTAKTLKGIAKKFIDYRDKVDYRELDDWSDNLDAVMEEVNKRDESIDDGTYSRSVEELLEKIANGAIVIDPKKIQFKESVDTPEDEYSDVNLYVNGIMYYTFTKEEWNEMSEEEKTACIMDAADQASDEEGHTVNEDEVDIIKESAKPSNKKRLTEAPEDEEEFEVVDEPTEEMPEAPMELPEEPEEMSQDEVEEEAEEDNKDTINDDIEQPFYATTEEYDELRDILVDLDYKLLLINDNMVVIGRLNGPDIEILTSNTNNEEADISEQNEKSEEIQERAEEDGETSYEYLWIKAPETLDKLIDQCNVIYLSSEMSDEDKEQYAGHEASHESVMNFLMNELPEDIKDEKEEEAEEEEIPAELPLDQTGEEDTFEDEDLSIEEPEEEEDEDEK